jgi:hypothetical protein
MSRVCILAFTLGILAGLVLSLDAVGLDVAPYYSQADRSDLQDLIEGLRP